MGSSLAPRKGGAFSTDRVEALLALLRARIAGGGGPNPGGSPVFVYQQGGVAGGNVYTSWPLMMAAVAKVAGPKWISVDPTFDLAPTVPPGSWNIDDCTFVLRFLGTGIGAISLTWEDGATIAPATTKITLSDTIFFVNAGATPWTVPVGLAKPPQIYCVSDGAFGGMAGAPFIHIPGGAGMVIFITGIESGIGDGVNPAIQIDAGGTLDVLASSGGALLQNSIAGVAGASFNVTLSGGAIMSQPVGFQPTAAFYFIPQINEQQSGAIGPAATVSFVASASSIQRSSSGKVRLSGGITATASAGTPAGTSVTFQLFRNPGGVLVGPAIKVGTDAALGVYGTIPYIDTIPDFVAHSYGIQATIAAGTLTVAVSGAFVSADELS